MRDGGSSLTLVLLTKCLSFLVAFVLPTVLGALHAPPTVSAERGRLTLTRAVRVQDQGLKSNSAQDDGGLLHPGATVKREIAGGTAHVFRLVLRRGQYAHLIAEQSGIDFRVIVKGPDGQTLAEMDSPNGLWGPESVSLVAKNDGEHMVELRPGKWAPTGSYELRLNGLREPTPADLQRVAAESAYLEGQSLRSQANPAAIERYKRARELWRALGDRRGEAYALYYVGWVYGATNQLKQAHQHFEEAISLHRAEGDLRGLSFVLNQLGSTHRDRGGALTGLDFYTQALDLRRGLGDQWGQAQILNNIGISYALHGEFGEALGYYEQALRLWQAAGDRNQEANTINGIGGALDGLGRTYEASEKYELALGYWQEMGNSEQAAVARNNLAKVYDGWGEANKALKLYELALSHIDEKKHPDREAQVLDNMGMLYVGRGDTQRAMANFDEALRLRKEAKLPKGLATTLHNQGLARSLQGELQEALKLYEQALAFRRQAKDRVGEALTLAGMGAVHASLGDTDKALDYYRQSLKIQEELENIWGQAIVVNRLGRIYTQLGDLPNASAHFQRALSLWEKVSDKHGKAQSLYGLAEVERRRNNPAAARDKIEEAIGIAESLRTKVTSQQLRISYLASVQDHFEAYINISMELYRQTGKPEHAAAALQASEWARARSLTDMLLEGAAGMRQGASDELIRRERGLQQRLNLKAREKAELLAAGKQTAKQVAAASKEIDKLIVELDGVRARIRETNPKYAALTQLPPPTLQDIQQRLLDDKSLMLEYALGAEKSYLWVVGRAAITGYELPKRAEIESATKRVYELLTAQQPVPNESAAERRRRVEEAAIQYPSRAAALSDMLLGPAVHQLAGKRLLVVGDGLLHYLPFSALPLPEPARAGSTLRSPDSPSPQPATRLMIEEHEIVSLPSITSALLMREEAAKRARAPISVAVFADPVFDAGDQRLRQARRARPAPPPTSATPATQAAIETLRGGFDLRPLPLTLEEAEAIKAAAPRGGVMLALGPAANRATLSKLVPGKYRIIHFATHGILDDTHPDLSGIALSLFDEHGNAQQDGILRLHDIYNLNLSADLIVLSACSTGLGNIVRGEGVVGLTRGFMYAGAPRVVASLWRVDDLATTLLMKKFYDRMLKRGMAPPAALREAQLELLKEKRWQSPYYWAPFVLHGEWQQMP